MFVKCSYFFSDGQEAMRKKHRIDKYYKGFS